MSQLKTMEKCETDLLCGVNHIKNLAEMTDLEKKHLPVITAPQSVNKGEFFDVLIEVGKAMTHPNELTHYIEFIELYAGDRYLARMDFTPCTTQPTIKATIALDHLHGDLRAFARCNLHGTWMGQVELNVT